MDAGGSGIIPAAHGTHPNGPECLVLGQRKLALAGDLRPATKVLATAERPITVRFRTRSGRSRSSDAGRKHYRLAPCGDAAPSTAGSRRWIRARASGTRQSSGGAGR